MFLRRKYLCSYLSPLAPRSDLSLRTTLKVNSFWCWLHEDDWCCRECRQTLITIINSDSSPSLPSTSPSLSRKPGCVYARSLATTVPLPTYSFTHHVLFYLGKESGRSRGSGLFISPSCVWNGNCSVAVRTESAATAVSVGESLPVRIISASFFSFPVALSALSAVDENETPELQPVMTLRDLL